MRFTRLSIPTLIEVICVTGYGWIPYLFSLEVYYELIIYELQA